MQCQPQTTNDSEMSTLLLLRRYLLCHPELVMPARLLGREVREENNEGGAERGSGAFSAAESFRSAPAIRYSDYEVNQPQRSGLLRLQLS